MPIRSCVVRYLCVARCASMPCVSHGRFALHILLALYTLRRTSDNFPSQTHWSPTLHDLIPLGPALPALGALTTAEIDATMRFAEAEKAVATRAAYLSDWRDFAAWWGRRQTWS